MTLQAVRHAGLGSLLFWGLCEHQIGAEGPEVNCRNVRPGTEHNWLLLAVPPTCSCNCVTDASAAKLQVHWHQESAFRIGSFVGWMNPGNLAAGRKMLRN